MELSLIVAIDQNNAIGGNNELLWHLPNDLKNFKKVTLGFPVIMGRKTFESIIKMTGKVLPNRKNIVISKNKNLKEQFLEHHFEFFDSLEHALEHIKLENFEKAFIIGGAQIYKISLPYVHTLYITLVKEKFENADTFFDIDFKNIESEYNLIFKEENFKDNNHNYDYDFLIYKKS